MSHQSPDRPNKPSDLIPFAMKVHEASATMLDFDQYYEIYFELLRVLMWNPDIDTPIAIAEQERQRAQKAKGRGAN